MPPIIGPASSSSATGATRATLRRRLAEELGMYGSYTVSSTPSASVTPDAARQVLVTALGADQVPESYFDGSYLYVADGTQAGETRKILEGSYDGPIGSLLLDRPVVGLLIDRVPFEELSQAFDFGVVLFERIAGLLPDPLPGGFQSDVAPLDLVELRVEGRDVAARTLPCRHHFGVFGSQDDFDFSGHGVTD